MNVHKNPHSFFVPQKGRLSLPLHNDGIGILFACAFGGQIPVDKNESLTRFHCRLSKAGLSEKATVRMESVRKKRVTKNLRKTFIGHNKCLKITIIN
jgi:hypothetical protein